MTAIATGDRTAPRETAGYGKLRAPFAGPALAPVTTAPTADALVSAGRDHARDVELDETRAALDTEVRELVATRRRLAEVEAELEQATAVVHQWNAAYAEQKTELDEARLKIETLNRAALHAQHAVFSEVGSRLALDRLLQQQRAEIEMWRALDRASRDATGKTCLEVLRELTEQKLNERAHEAIAEHERMRALTGPERAE
jgi:hypothetical protein